MTVSKQLDEWIERHGSARDALNIALARLNTAKFKLAELRSAIPYKDCPECGGVILDGWVCLSCDHDDSPF